MSDATPQSDHEIVLKREFNAPRALVFKVWSDPFHLAHWWVPFDLQATIVKMDVRPGGVFHINLQLPEGGIATAKAVFEKIVVPEMIRLRGEHTSTSDDCGAGIPPNAVVTISFEEKDEKTLLTLHTVFTSEERHSAAVAAGYNTGWNWTLNALAEYLEALNLDD